MPALYRGSALPKGKAYLHETLQVVLKGKTLLSPVSGYKTFLGICCLHPHHRTVWPWIRTLTCPLPPRPCRRWWCKCSGWISICGPQTCVALGRMIGLTWVTFNYGLRMGTTLIAADMVLPSHLIPRLNYFSRSLIYMLLRLRWWLLCRFPFHAIRWATHSAVSLLNV